MVHPDFNKEFYLQFDSFGYALGAYLYQLGDKFDQTQILFTSWTVHGSELRHTTIEKELFLLIPALKQWRPILLGFPVNMVADHKAITFLMNTKLKYAR